MAHNRNVSGMRKTEIQAMRRAIGSRSPLFSLLIFHFFLLFSCRTNPVTPEINLLESGFLPLEPGASVYIVANITQARPILEHVKISFSNNNQFRQMLDKTHSAVAAIYLPGNEQRFQLAAWGRYPVSSANMAFGFNKNWKKQRSAKPGATYWYSAQNRLSVALDQKEALVSAASGSSPIDPLAALPSQTKVPDGFAEFARGAILSCWLNSPASLINQKLGEMRISLEIPAEQIFVSLFPAAESEVAGGERLYTATVQIEVSNAIQARALASILTIGRGLFAFGENSGGDFALAAILFSNPPVLDGNKLIIITNALNAREISLLFGSFSL